MADGRHFEKSENGHNSTKVWPISTKYLARWRILAPWTGLVVKFSNFEKSQMANGAILNRKQPYLHNNNWPIGTISGTVMHVGPLNRIGRHLEKSKNGHNSATVYRSAQNLARWRKLALRTGLLVKFSNFEYPEMADGHHIKKSKTAITLQWFDRSARNLAQWRTLALQTRKACNISNF